MRVVIGLKAHSGWAAMVAVGDAGGQMHVVVRRRIELVDEMWAKQPYHAAQGLRLVEAQNLVQRGIGAARAATLRELRATVARLSEAGHEPAACAVLVGEPMQDWTTAEILSVHVRMHKAEGRLFQDALLRAAEACGLMPVRVREKELEQHAERALGIRRAELTRRVALLGKRIGAPWGKDRKAAAVGAMIGLASVP